MKRSLEEVKARCKSILNDEVVVNLVVKSSSPTAAFEMILAETGDQAKAKAGRWLAILRRDYVEEYHGITSNQVTLLQHDVGKENKNERDVHQKPTGLKQWVKRGIARLGKRKKTAR